MLQCYPFYGHEMLIDSSDGSDWQLQTALRKENNVSFNNVSTLHFSSDNVESRSDLTFRLIVNLCKSSSSSKDTSRLMFNCSFYFRLRKAKTFFSQISQDLILSFQLVCRSEERRILLYAGKFPFWASPGYWTAAAVIMVVTRTVLGQRTPARSVLNGPTL